MNTKASAKSDEQDVANPFEDSTATNDLGSEVEEVLTPTDGYVIRFLDNKVTIFSEGLERTIYRGYGNEISLRTILDTVQESATAPKNDTTK